MSPHSVPALLQVLQDPKEADMVRHEAAEALGSIATPEVLPYLKEYMTREDAPTVVRESCQVALDMYEVGVSYFLWNTVLGLSICRSQYENSDQFQYADGIRVMMYAEA
jgi:deoxyhypusine monooxygenase